MSFFTTYKQLQETEHAILEEINDILSSLPVDPEAAPVEHILHRIKGEESTMEKLHRKNLPVTEETALSHLSDIIAFRLVTHFIDDVYYILAEIEKRQLWEVIEIKDYIAKPKPNGYRSLHVIASIPFEDKKINFEIQLRTIAMDCWAALEHQLKYKKQIENAEILQRELKMCANYIASSDLIMQSIKNTLQMQEVSDEWKE